MGEVELLFGILPIMSTKTCVDLTFVREFISDRVAGSYKPAEKRAILEFFLSDFKAKFKAASKKDADEEQTAKDADALVANLKLVVLPMLSASLEGCSKESKKLAKARLIVNEDAVSGIVGDILDYADDESPRASIIQRAVPCTASATCNITHSMFAGRPRQASQGADQVWLEPLEARRPCVEAICVR